MPLSHVWVMDLPLETFQMGVEGRANVLDVGPACAFH